MALVKLSQNYTPSEAASFSSCVDWLSPLSLQVLVTLIQLQAPPPPPRFGWRGSSLQKILFHLWPPPNPTCIASRRTDSRPSFLGSVSFSPPHGRPDFVLTPAEQCFKPEPSRFLSTLMDPSFHFPTFLRPLTPLPKLPLRPAYFSNVRSASPSMTPGHFSRSTQGGNFPTLAPPVTLLTRLTIFLTRWRTPRSMLSLMVNALELDL